MTAIVLCRGSETDSFPIHTGVKQGCVAAPTLFSIFLTLVLILGVEIEYHMDGQLVILGRFRSKSKVTQASITDLQYADDCVILAHSEDTLLTTLNLFSSAYQSLGLSLNTGKTKVLHQPIPNTPSSPPSITISGEHLDNA